MPRFLAPSGRVEINPNGGTMSVLNVLPNHSKLRREKVFGFARGSAGSRMTARCVSVSIPGEKEPIQEPSGNRSKPLQNLDQKRKRPVSRAATRSWSKCPHAVLLVLLGRDPPESGLVVLILSFVDPEPLRKSPLRSSSLYMLVPGGLDLHFYHRQAVPVGKVKSVPAVAPRPISRKPSPSRN
jgi:hypothetical protein